MSRSTVEFLTDAREHAVRGRVYVADLAAEALAEPGVERDAFLYCLIAIGEAVKNIPAAVLSMEGDIPWHAAVATRNFVAHNYWRIDGVVLQKIAVFDLEHFVAAIDRLIDRVKGSA